MFVRCPACLTQFRIRAEHLSAAAGRVRCGACGQAFDAVGRLSDQPLPPASTDTVPVISEPDTGESLDFNLSSERPGSLADDTAPADDDMPHISSQIGGDEPASDMDWPGLEEDEPRSRYTGRWLVVALLLMVTLAGQATWFHRDTVYEYFPRFIPWVERLCERLQCQVYRQRQPAAFELINRDVRVHPVYEDALLVNATIANRADTRQPYPLIQLALFDTNGRPLGYREFAPNEYLDASLPVSAGMPPDTPIHVVLELSAPAEGAVSFEFGFL